MRTLFASKLAQKHIYRAEFKQKKNSTKHKIDKQQIFTIFIDLFSGSWLCLFFSNPIKIYQFRMFEKRVELHVFNSKSISAWFGIGFNSQLCGCRFNSILFIDVLLIADANGEFGFILINACRQLCCICCYHVDATQFILCKIMISIHMLRHVCVLNAHKHTHSHRLKTETACRYIYLCMYVCIFATNIGPNAHFLHHIARVKMREKNPIKKSIAIAIYLFIVMYFITDRRELVLFGTAWNHSLRKPILIQPADENSWATIYFPFPSILILESTW